MLLKGLNICKQKVNQKQKVFYKCAEITVLIGQILVVNNYADQ
jgi:hypothetical protein